MTQASDITRFGWVARFEVGEDMCAVLRAMRGRYRWANRAGTHDGVIYAWDRETATEVRTWLVGIDAVA